MELGVVARYTCSVTLAPVPTQEDPSLWSTVKEAIRGSHQDYTEAPIGRAVVLLAVPMVLEMMMESVFVVADVFFVGRLGPDAVATVGITESLMTVMYALAIGLSIGAAATVARRVGEKDHDSAARSAVQSVLMGLGAAAIFGTTGVLFGPQLLAHDGRERRGPSDRLHVRARDARRQRHRRAALPHQRRVSRRRRRGHRDARALVRQRDQHHPRAVPDLRSRAVSRDGRHGAAIGTTIGRGSGVLYQLFHLSRRGGRLQIHPRHLRFDLDAMRSILRISGTATFQNFVGTASWMGLVRILTGFGSAAVAGNTIGIRIILFALLPSFGVSNAAATLVGQNLGAGKPDRAEAAAWKAGMYNTVCLGTVGAIFLLFAPQLIQFFTADPEVARYGVRCLRIVSAGFLFYGYAMVLTASFNGAGDTRTPTLINLLCLWMWEIPLAWTLAHPFGFGPTGVFIAVSVAFSTMAFVSAWLFSRGTWKTKQV